MQDTYSVYFDNNICYIGISKSQVLLLCKIKKIQRELDKRFEDFNNHLKEKYDYSSLINENEIKVGNFVSFDLQSLENPIPP